MLIGICRIVGVFVSMLMGVFVDLEVTVIVLDTVVFILGKDIVEVWIVLDLLVIEDFCLAWVVIVMVWFVLGGIIFKFCTMRIVVVGFVFEEVIVFFFFWFVIFILSVGIKRKVEFEVFVGLRLGVILITVVFVGVDEGVLVELVLVGLLVVWIGLEVTCKVVEMFLFVVSFFVSKRFWVNLIVVIWDLVNVVIMFGVIRRIVWFLVFVVMEEGGRRNIFLFWIRKLVVVSGMLLFVWGFILSCLVIVIWMGKK